MKGNITAWVWQREAREFLRQSEQDQTGAGGVGKGRRGLAGVPISPEDPSGPSQGQDFFFRLLQTGCCRTRVRHQGVPAWR